jgi:hypothetical protein
MTDSVPIMLGWREWVAMPQFGLAAIKAKIDSGARSSSLHVESLEVLRRRGVPWLRFSLLTGRRGVPAALCEAAACDRRSVSDSGGHVTLRWFIRSEFELGGRRWEAEINLTSRRAMLFPLLLGRNALHGRFLVDPAASYRCGRPASRRERSRAP